MFLKPVPALLGNCAGHEVVQILPGIDSLDYELGEGCEVNESNTTGHDLVLPPRGIVPVGPVLKFDGVDLRIPVQSDRMLRMLQEYKD